MPRAAEIGRRYIDAMNAGEIDLMMSLFAKGAVMRHASGVFAGDAAIRDFFVEIAFGNAANLVEVEAVERGATLWLEVEATSKLTPGRQRVVDVFRLDEQGRIVDLGIYSGNIVPGSDG